MDSIKMEVTEDVIEQGYHDAEVEEKAASEFPKLIFKYRSVEKTIDLVRAIDILVKHRLYFSILDKLNDPFEGGNVDYLPDKDRDIVEKRIRECRILSLSEDCFSAPLWDR